ncbi:MAG: thiamine phosphate synthase, partial [Proteobacteria bacterium]
MKLPRIQFITQDSDRCSHLDCVKWFCKGGAKLIQLRLKEAKATGRRKLALEAKKLCEDAGALLVVNDHVELAGEISAAGVHLGRLDMHPERA